MTQLIRLTYASRSNSPLEAQIQGLDLGVARILKQSRKNNKQKQIVGGLLYGDGCFLQCLEGEEDVVSALYTKIEADQRHCDVTVLSRTLIDERSFGDWSMKYVPGERVLGGLMQGWGVTVFDPYVLTPNQIEKAVAYMLQQADAAQQLPGERKTHLDIDAKAPKSYIGKNIPVPSQIKAKDNSHVKPVIGIFSKLAWSVIGCVFVGLGAMLYFINR